MAHDNHDRLLAGLRARFKANRRGHEVHEWGCVLARLGRRPESLAASSEMEGAEGEPEAAGRDENTGEFLLFDCAPVRESSRARRW